MGFVLADTHGWLNPPTTTTTTTSSPPPSPPFTPITLQTFAALRAAVNNNSADFFMWEHFTSKRYYSNGEIKHIGEIYTPWPSWHIVARPEIIDEHAQLEDMMAKLNKGIRYFEENQEEAVRYISSELDYEEGDAREWLGTVRFAGDVRGVGGEVVEMTVEVLRKAGVVRGEVDVGGMVGIRREE